MTLSCVALIFSLNGHLYEIRYGLAVLVTYRA